MADDIQLLDHLIFDRVPDKEPDRRKRPGRPPGGLPTRGGEHGHDLQLQALKSEEQVSAVRRSLAVTADRLLVLELTSFDPGTREQIERLGAEVVEERRLPDKRWVLIVQFPDQAALKRFAGEASNFRTSTAGVLPAGGRDRLFEATDSVRPVSPEERKGLRLLESGLPNQETFYLDVDMWHPGDVTVAKQVLADLRALSDKHGGRVTDDGRTPTLLIARVQANKALAEALLSWDEVARVEIPSQPFVPQLLVLDPATVPTDLQPPDDSAPLIAILDSGVLSGHPMLQGSVYAEEDFSSGEDTEVDLHGHGTSVAGHVVFGDIASCIRNGAWVPRLRIASGKVLRRDKVYPDESPVFAEGVRPEHALEQAIRKLNTELGCRIFNISIGDLTPYAGGRQTPCAELLDKLARELDLVLVVAAGNVPLSRLVTVPTAATGDATQKAMLAAMIESPDQRVTDPATAALAVTVGSLSRSDAIHGDRRRVPATPVFTPAVFSRIGPGYSMQAPTDQAAVKPEFVAPGGNFAFESLTGATTWVTNDNGLREPTLRLPSKGGYLGYSAGTSIAAPQVTHAAGLAMDALTRSGTAQSANAIRALLGASAESVTSVQNALEGNKALGADKLSVEEAERLLVGYGICNPDRISGSISSDAVLLGEDSLTDDHWHVFEVPIPDDFATSPGRKSLSVALAFDPPTRSSRRTYLARTMTFYVVRGLGLQELEKFLTNPPKKKVVPGAAKGASAKTTKESHAERLPDKHCVDLEPSRTAVSYSTLQVRRRVWTKTPALPETIHIVVASQSRFDMDGTDEAQNYALAVRLTHDDDSVQIYEHIRSRARIRTRARVVTRA